jgi:hypothetical protein
MSDKKLTSLAESMRYAHIIEIMCRSDLGAELNRFRREQGISIVFDDTLISSVKAITVLKGSSIPRSKQEECIIELNPSFSNELLAESLQNRLATRQIQLSHSGCSSRKPGTPSL